MAFNHKHNTDNVFSRAVIVGLINLLNNKIQIVNQINDEEQDIIEVPWMFGESGDERFMQDYFTFWNDCVHPKMADGNYDVIPRGTIILTGESINSSALTHRFIRGKRVKEIDGQLHTFSAYLNSIPINMSFDCEVISDSYLDALKIQQTIREVFFKTQIFYTSYKGFRIPCQVGFPEEYGIEKTFEYNYGDDRKITLKFSLEVETYHPVVDKTSERHESNRIQGVNYTTNMINENNDIIIENKSIKIINPKDSYSNQLDTYYSGDDMIIVWENTGTILRVDIFYTLDHGIEWIPIVKNNINNGSYIWNVPFFQDKYPYVVLSQEGVKPALLRPIVGGSGSIIDIIIYDGGMGYDNNLTISIEEQNFLGVPANVEVFVTNGSITGFNIINGGSGYTPTIQKNIGIKVVDSNDQNIKDEVYNILIF